MDYVWKHQGWPNWRADLDSLHPVSLALQQKLARLLGQVGSLGVGTTARAQLELAAEEALRTSEIEGEILDAPTVRSSLARRLGVDLGGLSPSDRRVDGLVSMILDATVSFDQPLTRERLFSWHAGLFPEQSGGVMASGRFRDDRAGPMRVVSGELGREKVHYEAPPAARLEQEVDAFLRWLENDNTIDPLLKAGRAHLWFEVIHPFEDGNGRIGRAVSDLLIARAGGSPVRCFSLSAQIEKERREYYRQLEMASRGTLDDTGWLRWFLGCLDRAADGAEYIVSSVLRKARFWAGAGGLVLNTRQVDMLNRLFDGFEGKLTTGKWAKLSKCSPDTALRDINELVSRGVLRKEASGGRSTSYLLCEVRN